MSNTPVGGWRYDHRACGGDFLETLDTFASELPENLEEMFPCYWL